MTATRWVAATVLGAALAAGAAQAATNAHDWVTDLNGTSSVHGAFIDCLAG